MSQITVALSLFALLALPAFSGQGEGTPREGVLERRGAGAGDSDSSRSPDLKIAVLDLNWVWGNSRWVARREAARRKTEDGYEADLRLIQNEIVELMNQLEVLEKESKEYQQKRLELEIKQQKKKLTREMYQSWLNREGVQGEIEIFDTIQEKARTYAEQTGIHLVLKKWSKTDEERKASLLKRLNLRQSTPVLHSAARLDISSKVRDLLDAGLPEDASASQEGQDGKKGGGGGK